MPQKLSGAATAYIVTGGVIFGIILAIIGVLVLSIGTIAGTQTVNGVTSQSSISAFWPGLVLIVIGILTPFYKLLWCSLFSYAITDLNVTITSGVIFRQSKTIDLVRIQNVDTLYGPLQMLFGIAVLNIWTASPGQFMSSSSMITIGNTRQTQMTARPEGRLYLLRQDAENLRAQLSNRGAIQNVNIASSNSVAPS